MNKRDDAENLMSVLQQAMHHFDGKLSREVSLELVEHFVESSRTIDRILGLSAPFNNQPVAAPQVQAPKAPALATPPPPEQPEFVPVEGDVYRDGQWGKMLHTKAHQQRHKNGKIVDIPASERFYPYPQNSHKFKALNSVKSVSKKPTSTGMHSSEASPPDANGISMLGGRPGRLIQMPEMQYTQKDGTVRVQPAHVRWRPLGGKDMAKWDAAHGVDQPPPAKVTVSASTDGQIVERALQGELPEVIAADLKIDIEVVFRLMAKARREGGLVFPGDETGRNLSTASPLMQKIRGTQRAPQPPWWWENPNSPIWDNPRLLPDTVDVQGSMAAQGPMSALSFEAMTDAAARRGRTLRQHVAERVEIVKRVRLGERPVHVAAEMGWQPYNVYGLLAQVGYSAQTAAAQHGRAILGGGQKKRASR